MAKGPKLVLSHYSCINCDQLFLGHLDPSKEETLGGHCRLLSMKIHDSIDSKLETPSYCPLIKT